MIFHHRGHGVSQSFSFLVIQTTVGRKNLEYINVVVHEILRYTPFRSG